MFIFINLSFFHLGVSSLHYSKFSRVSQTDLQGAWNRCLTRVSFDFFNLTLIEFSASGGVALELNFNFVVRTSPWTFCGVTNIDLVGLLTFFATEAQDAFDFLGDWNLGLSIIVLLFFILTRWFLEVLQQDSEEEIEKDQVSQNEQSYEVDVGYITFRPEMVIQ